MIETVERQTMAVVFGSASTAGGARHHDRTPAQKSLSRERLRVDWSPVTSTGMTEDRNSPHRSVGRSEPPLDHHLLDFADRLGRVQALGTGLGAVHDRVAAIEAERVFEIVEALALC